MFAPMIRTMNGHPSTIHVQSSKTSDGYTGMDLLSEILQDAGLRRRVLALRSLPADAALRFPCDKSIGLHLAVQGPVHLHAGPGLVPGSAPGSAPSVDSSAASGDTAGEPLMLARGDIALMARGCTHVLSATPSLDGLAVEPIAPTGLDLAAGPPAEGAPAVISGAYQLWNQPLHPFFAELPGWTVLRAAERPALGPLALTTGLIEAELRQGQAGADTIVHALLDVVFTYALREAVERQGRAGAGWSHALQDPPVRRAVALMQADCAAPWTLEDLAQRAGLSRTALAERFRIAMGDTPLNHLRTLRMQRAMKLLADSNQPLEAIAAAVGYQDAFSFSKVFKRSLGVSPREFRQRDAAERDHPWRFKGG
jgi:AraC-like DNA-binding protein